MKIIRNTQIFARLHTRVMFELSSKYSLALYEFLQRRKNLRYVSRYEVLSVAEVRGLLGVASGRLKAFGHLNDKAIRPAAKEVSFLTDYEITAEPIRRGRGRHACQIFLDEEDRCRRADRRRRGARAQSHRPPRAHGGRGCQHRRNHRVPKR